MTRSIVTEYMRNPILAGACVLIGLAGCSSKNDGTGNGSPYPIGTGGLPGTGGTPVPGAGGSVTTASGGSVATSAGGSVVSTGGATITGGGTTGAAGTSTVSGGTTGVGGTTAAAGTTGAGGSSGGAAGSTGTAGAAGAGPMLKHCDQKSESAAKPELGACQDMTGVLGKTVTFGPAGAIMDINVGKGFENMNKESDCTAFASLFNEPADETKQLLDVGPQPCTATAPNTGVCLDFTLYSTYRPATWPEGKIPVISWANGTCAQPEGYGPLLRYVASYGFFVIAANSRQTGTGQEQLHALDFAKAANADPMSPYYGHLDLDKVGIMGHSQGGASTVAAASDARVKAAIVWNGGNSAVKPFLAVSGDMDIFVTTAAAMGQAVNAASKAAFLFYHNPAGAAADGIKGHLVLMLSPERVVEPTVKWWQAVLNNDPAATMYLTNLKTVANDFDYGEHGL